MQFVVVHGCRHKISAMLILSFYTVQKVFNILYFVRLLCAYFSILCGSVFYFNHKGARRITQRNTKDNLNSGPKIQRIFRYNEIFITSLFFRGRTLNIGKTACLIQTPSNCTEVLICVVGESSCLVGDTRCLLV